MPQTPAPGLYGHPDGLGFGFSVTTAILPALFGRFKLLITAIITSVEGGARGGALFVILMSFLIACFYLC